MGRKLSLGTVYVAQFDICTYMWIYTLAARRPIKIYIRLVPVARSKGMGVCMSVYDWVKATGMKGGLCHVIHFCLFSMSMY